MPLLAKSCEAASACLALARWLHSLSCIQANLIGAPVARRIPLPLASDDSILDLIDNHSMPSFGYLSSLLMLACLAIS